MIYNNRKFILLIKEKGEPDKTYKPVEKDLKEVNPIVLAYELPKWVTLELIRNHLEDVLEGALEGFLELQKSGDIEAEEAAAEEEPVVQKSRKRTPQIQIDRWLAEYRRFNGPATKFAKMIGVSYQTFMHWVHKAAPKSKSKDQIIDNEPDELRRDLVSGPQHHFISNEPTQTNSPGSPS